VSNPEPTNSKFLLDLIPRLALFSEGISGSIFHILPLAVDENVSIGSPHSLQLPLEPLPNTELTLSSTQLAALYRALIAQQLAPLLFGTNEFEFEEQEQSQTGEIRGDLQQLFQRQAQPTLARQLFYALEAIRWDARLRLDFPGLSLQLSQLNEAHADGMNQRFDTDQNLQQRVLHTLALLTCAIGIQSNPLGLPVNLHQLCEHAGKLRGVTATVYDSVALMTKFLASFGESISDLSLAEFEEVAASEPPANTLAEVTQQEDAVASLEFDLFELGEEIDLTPGEEPGNMAIKADLEEQRDNLKRRIDMQRARMARAEPTSNLGGMRSFLYDEWNYLESGYLKGWCRLYEKLIDPGDLDEVQALERKVADLVRQVRKQFERIRPDALERMRRLEDGDEIYLDALIEHEVDRRSGHVQDTRIYSTNTHKKREIATAFLVDLSASTDDALPELSASSDEVTLDDVDENDPFALDLTTLTPEPPKRRIIDVQREALWLMSKALEALGDDFGIYGFSGYGRDEVELFIVKELGARLSTQTLRSIVNMQPRRSTRMGPAIRHSISKLRAQGASRRILILISDGFPQDCDYGPDRGNHEYGLQDTAKALAEANACGIETFCITVDSSGHDYLNRMCQENSYMVIEETEELPLALTKVYRRLAF